ncbi:MAG TPA: tetratricopeptide repeat protein [Chthoniobacterales bacterium]|nr:tetratricopeptide repeat protein [Chthoniobacterales bacterium]
MKKILAPLVLAALVFAIYAPGLRNGFVWDDTALVLRDPLIRSWRLIPEGFQHFLFTDATASNFYRPIQRLTYTLDYAAFAFRPGGYHLTSILYHIAAALALLLFSGELLRSFEVEERKRRLVAFLATVAWAIHPVHNAAVAYVSGRADPLAAAFGFLGLYAGMRSLRTEGAKRWFFLFAAGALLLLSLLSKETGIVFLFLWGAILLLKKNWKAFLPVTVVALFVAVIYLSLRLPAEQVPPPTFRAPPPLLVRPILAARAVAEYAGLILLPINLHMDRDVETHPEGAPEAREKHAAGRELQTLLGILLIAAAIYWLMRSRTREPAIFCCLLLAALAYLPASGAFLLNASVAEHWIYLPTAFLFLAAALAISRLPISRNVAGSVLALWFLFLGTRTWMRNFDWKDQRTFLERTIASGGDSARMLINLAGLELSEGNFDTAKKHLALALRKEPDQPLAILNLATVAIRQDDVVAARDLLNRVPKIPLIEARVNELLAILDHKEKGRVDPLRFRLAARTGPPNWAIEKRYVEALDQSGATAAAIAELKSCLATQWYRAESWQLLSELLLKSGHSAEAAEAKARANAYDVHLAE